MNVLTLVIPLNKVVTKLAYFFGLFITCMMIFQRLALLDLFFVISLCC